MFYLVYVDGVTVRPTSLPTIVKFMQCEQNILLRLSKFKFYSIINSYPILFQIYNQILFFVSLTCLSLFYFASTQSNYNYS